MLRRFTSQTSSTRPPTYFGDSSLLIFLELLPLDEDSLPPYEVLDPVIKAYVEDDCSYQDMVAQGFEPQVVRQVISAVDRNEYKRRQAPPGVKITPRAFGKDRRLPIVNRYHQA